MKSIAISVLVAGALIGGAFYLATPGVESAQGSVSSPDNVKIVDGVQVVEIRARGGYQPRKSVAKAGLPTVINFNTEGTFDCSLAVRVPSLGIDKMLPPTGETKVDVGVPEAGKLRGSCGMGMYPFEINFVN